MVAPSPRPGWQPLLVLAVVAVGACGGGPAPLHQRDRFAGTIRVRPDGGGPFEGRLALERPGPGRGVLQLNLAVDGSPGSERNLTVLPEGGLRVFVDGVPVASTDQDAQRARLLRAAVGWDRPPRAAGRGADGWRLDTADGAMLVEIVTDEPTDPHHR